jgi:hypothetical protein
MLKGLLAILFSFSAWGFNLTADFRNGFYWENLPIGLTVIDKDVVRKEKLERIAIRAIREWEDSTGLALWSFSSSQTNPAYSNVIRWSENFAQETKMDPASVLAVAIRYTNGPYFARTEIVINGSHEMNKNDTYLRTTITHELGHTMGLDHSEVSSAVMAPSLQTFYWGLHQDDVAGMSAAHDETQMRQQTGYISPLAFEERKATPQALSCATVSTLPIAASSPFPGLISLLSGLLISFVGKLWRWFKS